MQKTIKDIITETEIFNKGMSGTKLVTRELVEATKDYTTEAVKMALAESTLDEAQIKAILSAQGLKGATLESTAAKLAATAQTNAMAASEVAATGTTAGLSTAFKGLGLALKGLVASHPVLIAMMATAAGIYGVVKILLHAYLQNFYPSVEMNQIHT
ncbi:hypothetical protein RJD28_11520 [Oscillospiraceae bacterium NTUH-002-81]|nr:hypothetical protein RJD28_11520 [Oscillospiraceae bacterium NTUH-002-81]